MSKPFFSLKPLLSKTHHHRNNQQHQWKRDKLKVISLIKSCSKDTHVLQIHAQIVTSSLDSDSAVCLEFLTRSSSLVLLRDNLRYSRKFFDQISRPRLVHFNAMIRAYSASDSSAAMEEGLWLYRHIQTRGLKPNAFSSNFAAKCCAGAPALTVGVQVHARVFRDGSKSDTHLLTSLTEMYARCGKFADARKVFDEMPHRDTVAWNALISCCLRGDQAPEAMALFDAMRVGENGCEPDEVTCLLALQASSESNALEVGERVHRHIEEKGYYGNRTDLKNSLVSMYSRCGDLEKASRVFREIGNKDVVSWTAMISGLAMNGRGNEALEAFREMEKTGVSPNEHTFTGFLSACSHSGLVDQGTTIFNRMWTEFGVSRNVRHYGCMVDLFGRAGLLDQAYRLVLCMDVDPDPEIWRTLLGSCRIHGRVDLAERVVAHLVEIGAEQAVDYVLLSSVYSSAGYWDKVREVRKLLKEKAMTTTRGRSTIELGGAVHEFAVDDFSHPQKDEIFEVLFEINRRLKIAGCVVDESWEDVTD